MEDALTPRAAAASVPAELGGSLLALPAPPSAGRASVWVQAGIMVLGAMLVVAAVYAFFVISERREAVRHVSGYNLSWTAGQAALEVSRLQAALGAYAATHGEVERDAVELWFDLVDSRVALLRRGEPGAFIGSSSELTAIVEQIAATVELGRLLLPRLEQPDSLNELMRSLQRLNPGMARMVSLAHGHAAAESQRNAAELASLYWRLSGLLTGLIACSSALAGVAIWRNRALARAHGDVRRLVDDLTRTGQSLSAANDRATAAMQALTEQNAVLQARDAALRRRNELFDAALNNMSQGLAMFDAGHRLIVSNRRFGELLQLRTEQMVAGAVAADLLMQAGETGGFGRTALAGVWSEHQRLARQRAGATFVREDSEGRSLWVSQRPLADGGWVATYEDVTESRRAEARIRHLANHDALTDLPNRRRFSEHLTETLGALKAPGPAARRSESSGAAVLLIDLDNFKKVNDTLGHQAGDALLCAAAHRIRACLRRNDLLARLGGDEFAVMLRGESDWPNRLETIARRITGALAEPFVLERFRASIGASIGIALAQEPGLDADTVMKHADVALYRAKSAGRGTYRVFEASMAAELQGRMELENDLRSALDNGQLLLHYQPLFDLRRGRLSGFEALLRWRHPSHGMVSPARFIPIAEETGLILPIGAWVLRQACIEAASMPGSAKVAVNISPVQFAGDNLPALVQEALEASGLEPERLELEITESVLLEETDLVLTTLHRLREFGVGIALDDFGTKYSSLGYLRSFPFDKIKIDQSFVRDMGTREDCLAIVQSVAQLAARLGMTATAEGVEDGEHLEQVRQAGCTQAQGYFLGRPSPREALGAYFEAREPALVATG